MPKAWSRKDERKYQHIKASQRELGASARWAEEIAARTVNKSRRLEGRTPNRTSQGTGNPRSSLEERSVQELRNRAAELGIKGRSRMNKSALIDAIRAAA
jgi:hypothetical protein